MLEQALALAEQNNPRLQQMRARVDLARAGKEVAFAEFLPQANTTFRHIQGSPAHEPFALPTLPTAVGNVAFGGSSDRFDTTELHLQWTVFDFGRRTGRFGQAVAAVDIAELQYQRARQTVVFNVTAAYLAVLRYHAERRIAEEAVRRAESLLRDARNFLNRGTAIRNDVLRTEVLLAEARLGLVKAHTAEGIALAGLNQEMGVQADSVAQIPLEDEPDASRPPALPDALQMAVANRPEFTAAVRAIASARLGEGVARADFLPKVVAGGTAVHQETNDRSTADLFTGGVGVEISLFEGGRRAGRLHGARAELAVAVAQGQEVCDRITYEVQTTFLMLDDARERVALARTDAARADENLRVVRRLFDRGDATPTDVADGDLAFVRGQQNEAAAAYDYRIALARLVYAVGITPEGWDKACAATERE
jgi:outer membrane protein TolC